MSTKTQRDGLQERILEITSSPHYKCIRLFIDDKLRKFWDFSTPQDIYIRKTVAFDHEMINKRLKIKKIDPYFF